jgi:hypothetical protein
MEKLKHKWRFGLEAFLLITALILTYSFVSAFYWPKLSVLVVYVLWLAYYFFQLKIKLGLTLPFIFIVVWMIFAIMDWNENQEVKSFDLEDYQLAIAYVLHALNGAVIYFENKMRW